MNAHNPYAPSPASLKATGKAGDAASMTGVWRDGDILVMTQGAELPDRCVKCNEAAAAPTKDRTLYWHHPGIYALLLFNLIIYLVTAMIVRKKAVVAPGLCQQHKQRRSRVLLLGWLGIIVGLGMLVYGASNDGPGVMILGVLVCLVSIILCLILARIVYPKRIDKAFVRLKGCGEDFLNTLPAFRG
jgi:hypothetical protein